MKNTKITIENPIKLDIYTTPTQVDEALLNYGSLANFIASLINIEKKTDGQASFKKSWEMLFPTFQAYRRNLPLYFKIGRGSTHMWIKQVDPTTNRTIGERLIFVEFN